MYRDHNCGELNISNVGEIVTIAGWIQRIRNLGSMKFIDLRDQFGITQIVIGDNDTLSAIIAANIGADLLILLSDINGLYTADPRTDKTARLVREVPALTDEVLALGGGAGTARGTGGMATKLSAARIATAAGIPVVIANGQRPECLYDIVAGKPVGTRFAAQREGTA